MKTEYEPVTDTADWYTTTQLSHKGELVPKGFAPCARNLVHRYRRWRTEVDGRTKDYWKYDKQAAAEVVSQKTDMPNISSGENAGFVRRIARNVVQHTPNVFIANQFDDDSVQGIVARHILKTKIIGDDEYSNDMQQHLVTTARRGFTIGYDAVVPVLLQDATGGYYVQYDAIHYRDVYPEPGAKDIRRANEVYVRRYMTKGELFKIMRDQIPGWDHAAIKTLLGMPPATRRTKDHESGKHSFNPEAYEIITWYNSYGDPFLWFEERTSLLIRIEENKHPLKEHPVMFFVPERDDQQAWGKSLLSLTYGRQEFQDLFMNGSMKMFYRNINPPIIGYGTINAMPNLSPGKYTEISNPNAKIEPLEINTQALMMFGSISQQNQAQMVSLIGAADQQMAAQSTGGMMSQTPQGVEAQQQMVDITTNNYQKAMENFFSKYCSYALTIYFAELKGTKAITPTADVRKKLIDEGIPADAFLHEEQLIPVYGEDGEWVEDVIQPADDTGLKDGALKIDFEELAVLYYVQCVPGSLVEMEDDKQLRILKEIFVPLSQAMPALANAGDTEALANASNALQYIVQKTIELSGSAHSSELTKILTGQTDKHQAAEARIKTLEDALNGRVVETEEESEAQFNVIKSLQDDIKVLQEGLTAVLGGAQPGGGGQIVPLTAAAPETGVPIPSPVPA
jgi:hypothetical protein